LHSSDTSQGGHRGGGHFDAPDEVVVIFHDKGVVAERRELHIVREQKQRVGPHTIPRATGDVHVTRKGRHRLCGEVNQADQVIGRVCYECDSTDWRDAHAARVIEERMSPDAIP
jgi:hypothetical protein